MRTKKMFCALFFFGVVFFLFSQVFAMPTGWTNDHRLTNDAGQSLYPTIICNATGNSVYAAWTDDRNGYWGIYFSRSYDQGLTWSAATNITNHTADAVYPQLYWYAPNTLLLTWLDYRNGAPDIYTMKSLDQGSTWMDLQNIPGQVTNVSNRGDSGAAFSRPRTVINTFGTHVVWADNTSGSSKIYYRNVTVAATVSIKVDSSSATLPAISTLNGGMGSNPNLYIAWEETPGAAGSIYFTQSVDGGVIWTDGNGAPGSYDISFKFGASSARHPDIVVSGDTATGVEVGFLDNRQGTDQVYWETGRTDSGLPIIWDDGMFFSGIAPNTLTSFAVAPDWLAMCSTSSEHLVVWQDNRDGNYELYMREGMGGGAIMFDPVVRLTSNAADSILPSITGNDPFSTSVSIHYIAWADNRDSNYEIYFKRTDQNGPAAITDLAAVTGSNPGEVDLVWTAPADDVSDPVWIYDIGHDGAVITTIWDFRNNATQVVQNMVPQSAGQSESYTVSGLVPGNSYYFSVLSVDEAGNSATVSNSPPATAQDVFTPSPTITISPTVSPTATISPTGTQTPVVTITGTATITWTQTVTATETPTATRTPVVTITGTATITWTQTVTATETPTAIRTPRTADFSEGDLMVFPNPAREEIYFAHPMPATGTVFIRIYNMAGEKIAEIKQNAEQNSRGVSTKWECHQVGAGIYIVKVKVVYTDGTSNCYQSKLAITK